LPQPGLPKGQPLDEGIAPTPARYPSLAPTSSASGTTSTLSVSV
jgi:hypothetical protein